jgi:hypothetical protein
MYEHASTTLASEAEAVWVGQAWVQQTASRWAQPHEIEWLASMIHDLIADALRPPSSALEVELTRTDDTLRVGVSRLGLLTGQEVQGREIVAPAPGAFEASADRWGVSVWAELVRLTYPSATATH